ncbi:MAG: Killer protein [Desulfobulbaceae bacterium]|nr:Killer protein [Desulfobulbaceae bacterium]
MIENFKHKGLELFFMTGSSKASNPKHMPRLQERLQPLHTAMSIEDMDIPGWRLHPLKGNRSGLWAGSVSGNWGVSLS